VRFVGRQRGAAIVDELVEIKHSHIPSADAVVPSDLTLLKDKWRNARILGVSARRQTHKATTRC
jgi:hypothetical protein